MSAAENRSDAAMVKRILSDPSTVLPRLGFRTRRDGSGWKILCPWHSEKTPSCSVQRRDGVLLAKCHGCDEGGDVISLIAAVERLSLPRDFPEALRRAADMAGIALDDSGPREYAARPIPEPAQRPYPPFAEVMGLWSAATPTSQDDAVAGWLRSRGLEPKCIDQHDAARVLPRLPPSWAAFRGTRDVAVSWEQTGHRLIVPMRGVDGSIRSVRARSIVASDDPKTLPPSGFRSSGLVMACPIAKMMLESGTWPPFADGRLVIVEGEPDFLSWAGRCDGQRLFGVIGITSGSWTSEIAARVPSGSKVIVRTDLDPAGEKYADAIRGSLGDRCNVLRKAAR